MIDHAERAKDTAEMIVHLWDLELTTEEFNDVVDTIAAYGRAVEREIEEKAQARITRLEKAVNDGLGLAKFLYEHHYEDYAGLSYGAVEDFEQALAQEDNHDLYTREYPCGDAVED